MGLWHPLSVPQAQIWRRAGGEPGPLTGPGASMPLKIKVISRSVMEGNLMMDSHGLQAETPP